MELFNLPEPEMTEHRPVTGLADDQRGTILVLSLVLLALMSVMGLTIALLTSADVQTASNYQQNAELTNMAESALDLVRRNADNVQTLADSANTLSTQTLGTYSVEVQATNLTAEETACYPAMSQVSAGVGTGGLTVVNHYFLMYGRPVSETDGFTRTITGAGKMIEMVGCRITLSK